MTYNMNSLQARLDTTPLRQPQARTDAIEPSKIRRPLSYRPPKIPSPCSAARSARWQELLGANHTFFCGATPTFS